MTPLIFLIALFPLAALAVHYHTPTGELLVSCRCRGDWVASKSECREAHEAGKSRRCYEIDKICEMRSKVKK